MKLIIKGALCFLLTSRCVFSWGTAGHMIVAEIAYQRLSPATKHKIAALLKLNPQYKQWIAGIPLAQRDEAAFVMASTWPDLIKRTRGYSNDGSIHGTFWMPPGTLATRTSCNTDTGITSTCLSLPMEHRL